MRKMLQLLMILVLCTILMNGTALFAQNYSGSESCKSCHSGIHADWQKSGHAYKLQRIEEGNPPQYPAGLSSQKVVGPEVDYTIEPGVPQPPKGYAWNEIGWVLGGYHAKARFINLEGYRILGDSTQYNLATDKWVRYNQSDPGTATYAYSCFRCHTTGASDTSNAEFDQYPGIVGSWVEAGIGCEGCHGPSADHVANFSTVKPPKEGLNTCNNCHARDRGEQFAWNERVQWQPRTVNDVPTGFIRHREQGDMMLASKHGKGNMQCTTCHESHKGVFYELGGLKEDVTCQSCHTNKEIAGHGPEKAECVDCHMPFASRTAETFTPYVADISAHYWAINTDPITMFANLDTIGGNYFIKTDGEGLSSLTLDYTCVQCHVSQDVEWASQYAKNIHEVGVSIEDGDLVPSGYTLAQNYPNPFNPVTTIAFSIPGANHVKIDLYSIQGRFLQTIVDGQVAGGRHEITFDGSQLASGLYLYKITAGEFSYSRKMMLIK